MRSAGVKTVAAPSMQISVAMIVRNEEAMLPGCLAALGTNCELVVVDTGSSDGTRELVRKAGATVVDFPWCDDFSSARNVALEHCTGDWVFIIDADERVSPELWQQLQALVQRGDAGAATVRMRNLQAHGHVRESRLLRVFRRDPLIRFRYPIHEDVSQGVSTYLKQTGRQLVHLDGLVDHLGYTREHAAARGKKERDQGMLERLLDASPDDLYTHFKLLELARFWKDAPLAAKVAPKAAAAVDRAPLETLNGNLWVGELLVLVASAMHGKDSVGALRYLESYSTRIRPSAAWELRRAELLELLGHTEASRAAFAACAALGADLGDLQLSTVRPRIGLARLAIAEGRLQEAFAWAQRALSFAPDDPEAKLACDLLKRQLLPAA
jgi:hypothetical protein